MWVNDLVFPHMSDGMAMLIDGDTDRCLGTLSTGWGFVRVLLPKAGQLIYSPEIYFSRGTRGVRTDVVTIYDAHTLSPVKEIPDPAEALRQHADDGEHGIGPMMTGTCSSTISPLRNRSASST